MSGPGACKHYGSVMVLPVVSVTAPVCASARPKRVAVEFRLMLTWARMFPCHADAVPSVGELPMTQYTFFAWAPLISTTDPAVTSELPAWKTNVAFGFPPPSSVSVPVTPMPIAVHQTPAVLVVPPRSATMKFDGEHGSPARVLYAVCMSICACRATPSARCCTPVITQGPNPTSALPGLIITSALMVPVFVQVTVVAARMPLDAAAPRATSGGGGPSDVTVTFAVPEIAPLVACTVLLKDPDTPPAVNKPALLTTPPPLMTAQMGDITNTLPLASLPTATNCWVEFTGIETGFGVTVMLANGPLVTMTVAKPESPPKLARMVFVNVPDTVPAVKSPDPMMVPPFATTAQVGAMATRFPAA